VNTLTDHRQIKNPDIFTNTLVGISEFRNPPPLTVSCAPSGDEGPTSYIEIEKTKNKLSETKGNNKKTNKQTNKIKINIKKKKKKKNKKTNNPRA
jgi:hypothetical protein